MWQGSLRLISTRPDSQLSACDSDPSEEGWDSMGQGLPLKSPGLPGLPSCGCPGLQRPHRAEEPGV